MAVLAGDSQIPSILLYILEVVFIATYVISEEAYGNAERHLYNRKP